MTEWILAFDAGCGSCSGVAERVGQVVGDRLSVVSLADDRIRRLREEALGEHARWAPTLLSVDAGGVRAWTGPRMSARLARLLGPSRSYRVVRALSDADVVVHGERRRFLKAIPGVAIGAFVVSGGIAAPAMAAQHRPTAGEARHWVEAHKDTLPTGYDDVVGYPMAYRKAIFAASSPAIKASLWKEHLRRYVDSRRRLTADQVAVVGQAREVAGEAFTQGVAEARTQELKRRAIDVFGLDEARALLATLGPAVHDDIAGPPLCECSSVDGYCWDCIVNKDGCIWTSPPDGCGTLYLYTCNGMC